MSTATISPVMASTLTSVMFLVPGVAISKDQMSLPFSFSSSDSLIVPLGTLARAIFSASAFVILASLVLGDVQAVKLQNKPTVAINLMTFLEFIFCFLVNSVRTMFDMGTLFETN